VAQPRVRAAGGDARGRRDRIQGLDHAVDGLELVLERLAVQPRVRVIPARLEAPPDRALDLAGHVRLGAAHEALDDLGLGQGPTEVGEDHRIDAHGDRLAVNEHAVTVEDHEVPRQATQGNGRRLELRPPADRA
jgi:hypothetical protein